ncbi:hypothetical protein [Chthonobacter rhizosphaerae]|uniref:hypothetical protein n=1 Tax=Chthonobacter rhizosphaerae TaxID=2735553 RepID=UPI0015EF18E5|nr:hypothetical protein [Chthonobacter rhizosphaerae]
MRILIGSPTADGDVELSYCSALLTLVGTFMRTRPDITFELDMPQGRDIAGARDRLANKVLDEPDYTHLLFVDADMGFRPALIETLIKADKPIIGTIAPQRHRDLDLLREMHGTYQNGMLAEVCAASYTPGLDSLAPERMLDGEGSLGLIQARQTGAGILLIRRDALEIMRLRCPQLTLTQPSAGRPAGFTRFFAPRRGPEGVLLGEDLSFTSRWVDECHGDLWVAADAIITHAGTRVVTGNYDLRQKLVGAR